MKDLNDATFEAAVSNAGTIWITDSIGSIETPIWARLTGACAKLKIGCMDPKPDPPDKPGFVKLFNLKIADGFSALK